MFFASGASERYTITATETRHNGLKRLEVTESKSDGSCGSWTLQEGASKSDLQGYWIN